MQSPMDDVGGLDFAERQIHSTYHECFIVKSPSENLVKMTAAIQLMLTYSAVY